MYYLLNEECSLCGYKGLPFGIRYERIGAVDFFDREQYELVLMLDGQTPVEREKLTQAQQRLLDHLTGIRAVSETDGTGELTEAQKYRLYPAMYKRDVQWSITGKCNYRCRHCFMSAPDCRFTEPSREECMDYIHQMAECGIRSVSLTGGEPLVSPWFYDILDECRHCHIRVSTIYSNGALVNEQLVEELKKRDMRPAFHMSFDGIGWHDWLRGINGAEEKVIGAFRLLRANGFVLSSSLCLHKHNLEGLNASIRLMDSLGLSHLKTNIATPAGLWAKETGHFLDPDETCAYLLDTVIPRYLEDDPDMGVQFCGLLDYSKRNGTCYIPLCKFGGREDSLSSYACGAVKNGMYLSPEGYVLPCMTMVGTDIQPQFPSLKDMTLSQILSDSAYTEACFATGRQVVDHNEKCAECPYRCLCGGGCRACATGEHCTDYFAVDEETCRFFRNGWYERAKALVEELKKRGHVSGEQPEDRTDC